MEGPTTSPNADAEAPQMVPGLTELIASVLEQLAVSAWLTVAMLMGVGSLLVQLRSQDSLDVAAAVDVPRREEMAPPPCDDHRLGLPGPVGAEKRSGKPVSDSRCWNG